MKNGGKNKSVVFIILFSIEKRKQEIDKYKLNVQENLTKNMNLTVTRHIFSAYKAVD